MNALQSFSRNFSYEYEGQTIIYTVLDEKTKTCRTADGNWRGELPGNLVLGDLILPSNPKDGGVEYTLTALGYNAFKDCSSLTSIEIPNSVTAIRAKAFEECTSLTWVIIPYSVTTFEWSIFNNCRNLIKTAYPSTMANPFESGVNIKYPAKGAIIDNGVVYGVDKSAIYFAPLGLEGDFIISDSVKAIGLYSFYSCEGITSVEIPASVTSIDSNAFDGCIGLTSVSMSKNLIKIGSRAFDGCKRIKTIIYPTQNPCIPDKEIFMVELYRKTTLYVPDGAINTFKSMAPWSAFNHIKGLEASGIEDAMNNYDNSEIDCSAPYDVYNLNGVKVSNSTDDLAPGLYIIRQGRLSKKITLN